MNMDRRRKFAGRENQPSVAAVVHTKTPETWGLWRLILEGLAVLIECCAFRLPSGLLPVCTGDRPFSLAFQLTFDSRPRSTFRRCLPTQPPTLIGCQILWLALRSVSSLRLEPTLRLNLPAYLRLASPINLPALPLHRPATFAACRSSGHAFRLTSSFRLRSIFQLNLPIDLDSRPINLPVLP